MRLSKNIKIFLNYFLGPLLFIWLSWSLYMQIMHQPDLDKAWKQISESFGSTVLWNLVAVVFLMFINWSIEAFKWKTSIDKIQKVSFLKALKAILSGVSFSVSTPNRVGEYFGRVLYMDDGNRLKTISITIVGSISQLLVTLLMGSIGLLVLRPGIEAGNIVSPIWMKVIIYGVVTVLVGLTLFYFRISWLVKWIDRIPGSSRFAYLIRALEEFDATLLIKLLSLSLLRFIVFIVQYYLLFKLFFVDISWWQAYWAVSVSFLVMAVIPTIAIAELAQRGKVTTTIIGLYSTNELGMTFATISIWAINLILPAIIGSILILGIKKIYKEKNEGI